MVDADREVPAYPEGVPGKAAVPPAFSLASAFRCFAAAWCRRDTIAFNRGVAGCRARLDSAGCARTLLRRNRIRAGELNRLRLIIRRGPEEPFGDLAAQRRLHKRDNAADRRRSDEEVAHTVMLLLRTD